MKAWIISDTHTKERELIVPKDVELVIHAGDGGHSKAVDQNKSQLEDFFEWYHDLQIKYKIFVPGNHDVSFYTMDIAPEYISDEIIILNHKATFIEGINFFGSPYTPKFGKRWVYNASDSELEEYWKEIPENTDVLITHGPPKGIMDLTQYDSRPGADGKSYFQCGDKRLLERIKTLKPRLHIFGHIHDELNCINAGILHLTIIPDTTFINASVVNLKGQLTNNGIIIDL